MKVPYSKMLSFILSGHKLLYPHLFEGELGFSFENYIKSELHLQTVPDVYGRDILQYYGALKYLRGDESQRQACVAVLKYFYQDMGNMICNVLKDDPKKNVRITIDCRINRYVEIPTKRISLKEVVIDLEYVMTGESSAIKNSFATSIFAKFDPGFLDNLVPNELLALASILTHYAHSPETYLLEVT
jgi:hypothetical protein